MKIVRHEKTESNLISNLFTLLMDVVIKACKLDLIKYRLENRKLQLVEVNVITMTLMIESEQAVQIQNNMKFYMREVERRINVDKTRKPKTCI